jgi:hypothetical protein
MRHQLGSDDQTPLLALYTIRTKCRAAVFRSAVLQISAVASVGDLLSGYIVTLITRTIL